MANLHGKHGNWVIKDKLDTGWNATAGGKAPSPAVTEPVKLAEAVVAPSQGEAPHRARINSYNGVCDAIVDNHNDNDPSSSVRRTDVALTGDRGWGCGVQDEPSEQIGHHGPAN